MGHEFCRLMLKDIMEEVSLHVPPEIIREAWAYRDKDYIEFQIPSQKFFWYGQGCCKAWAKYKGWESYLNKLGVYGDGED